MEDNPPTKGQPDADSSSTGRSLRDAVRDVAPTEVYNWSAGGLFINLLNIITILKISDDMDSLERYGIEKTDTRYVYYLLYVFTWALGPLFYLWKRRQRLLDSPTFDREDYKRARGNLNVGKPLIVWTALGLFFLGLLLPSEGTAGTVKLVCLLTSIVATPLTVFYDSRVLRLNDIIWGDSRYIHVIISFIPLLAVVYLFQRGEHVFYTALVKSTKR